MDPQNNYQFIMIPQQLSSCLDANCHKMLTVLIGLSSLLAKDDGWFFRSNKDLQLDTRFSQNLVIATLDTLYQADIIDIDCVGKGRGHRSNRLHINYDAFLKYENYSFNEIRNNPDLWIETVPYKNHYSPSYCKETGKEKGNTIGKGIGKKVTTNTHTTDISNTKEENNIIYKEEDMKVIPKEDYDTFFDESERNLVMILEEEKPCSKDELKSIYVSSFEDTLNNYPGLNYSLLLANQKDSFYDCYRDVVNELVMKIHMESQRDITADDVLFTFNSYLNYIHYSYQ